jgi:hypothetical protein
MKTTVKSIIGSVAILTTLAVSSYGQEAKTTNLTETKKKSAGVAVAGEKKDELILVDGIRVSPSRQNALQGKEVPAKTSTQETLSIQRSKRFDFDDESTNAETKIKSTEEYNVLLIAVATALNQGSIVVDILDPKGVKQGTFTLVADEPSVVGGKTKYTGSVTGQIQKQFRYPMKGEWIIRATPTNAKGSVDIRIKQEFIPNLDYKELSAFEIR